MQYQKQLRLDVNSFKIAEPEEDAWLGIFDLEKSLTKIDKVGKLISKIL